MEILKAMEDFQPHPLVEAGDDPSNVRLLGITVMYIVNVFLPLYLGLELSDSYWGIYLAFVYTVVAALIWLTPAVLMALHLLLFGWLNIFEEASATVWLIERWVSNLGFIFNVGGSVFAILIAILNPDEVGIAWYHVMLYSLYALAAESLQWHHGIGVINTIAPDWNEHSGKLYPRFFYRFDWVDETASVSYQRNEANFEI